MTFVTHIPSLETSKAVFEHGTENFSGENGTKKISENEVNEHCIVFVEFDGRCKNRDCFEMGSSKIFNPLRLV